MIRMVAAGVLLSLASCARRQVVPSPADHPSDAAASVAHAVTLERTACFGSCPVYSISVSPSGEVTYDGKAHVRRTGAATARIPRDRVEALLSELERAGYFSFADRYLPSEPACGRAATDAPTVTTSVTLGGRTKRIAHYYGCSSVPGALTILEQRIDETLNSGQWTGH
jgi:uncharacterized protein DUF6438